MEDKSAFKVGSRKSQLAIIQTNEVIRRLKDAFPDKSFEIVEMTTVGDRILDKALPKIGEKSLFTKELEEALLCKRVDFVVHSLKDLPTMLPDGLTIGGVLEREDPRDALILSSRYEGENLKSLPDSSVIGTSSLRRTAQLCRGYPNLKVENIRGNLNTRLRKLDEDDAYDGIVLAVAGINRMQWKDRITEYLDPAQFLYAVGQGVIAVECRSTDETVLSILENLNHFETIFSAVCERSFLKTLGGGCSAPIGVHSVFAEKSFAMTGVVLSLDGAKMIEKSIKINLKSDETDPPPRKLPNVERKIRVGICAKSIDKNGCDLNAAEELGRKLANAMIDSGALTMIKEAKLVNDKLARVAHREESKSEDSFVDDN